MNRDETINILSVLKATYPQSFRNMSVEEGRGTISAWLMDFEDVDYIYVQMAVKRYKSDITKAFAPNINDIHKILNDMVCEANAALCADVSARRILKLPQCCINCTSYDNDLMMNNPCWGEILCPRAINNQEYYRQQKTKILSDDKIKALKAMIDNIQNKDKQNDVLSLLGFENDIKLIGGKK